MGQPGDEGGPGGPMGGGGITGGIGDMDFGDDVPPDAMGDEAAMGEEGEMSMADAAMEDTAGDVGAGPTPNESLSRLLKNAINEHHKTQKILMEGGKQYSEMLKEQRTKDQIKEENIIETIPLYNKNFFINEELDSISKELDKIVND